MNRDENYIIDLCDAVLGLKAKRQHRFPFLLGDPGKSGLCATLPVDAYYEHEELQLVIEYRERQHSEDHPFFNRRPGRREQRLRYDERREQILPQHGIRLVILDYTDFEHDGRKRLKRSRAADEAVIERKLAPFLVRK